MKWHKVIGNSTGSKIYPKIGERVYSIGFLEVHNGYESSIFLTKRGSVLLLRMCDLEKDNSSYYGFNGFWKDLFRFTKW